jgi:hypothetical protein
MILMDEFAAIVGSLVPSSYSYIEDSRARRGKANRIEKALTITINTAATSSQTSLQNVIFFAHERFWA